MIFLTLRVLRGESRGEPGRRAALVSERGRRGVDIPGREIQGAGGMVKTRVRANIFFPFGQKSGVVEGDG